MEVKDKLVTLEDLKLANDNLNTKISTINTDISTINGQINTIHSNLNQLNGDKVSKKRIGNNVEIELPIFPYSSALVLGTINGNINGFFLISRGITEVSIVPLTGASKPTDFSVTLKTDSIILKTIESTDLKVFY